MSRLACGMNIGWPKRRWVKEGLAKYGGGYQVGVIRSKPIFYYEKLVSGIASERDYLKRGLRVRCSTFSRVEVSMPPLCWASARRRSKT